MTATVKAWTYGEIRGGGERWQLRGYHGNVLCTVVRLPGSLTRAYVGGDFLDFPLPGTQTSFSGSTTAAPTSAVIAVRRKLRRENAFTDALRSTHLAAA